MLHRGASRAVSFRKWIAVALVFFCLYILWGFYSRPKWRVVGDVNWDMDTCNGRVEFISQAHVRHERDFSLLDLERGIATVPYDVPAFRPLSPATLSFFDLLRSSQDGIATAGEPEVIDYYGSLSFSYSGSFASSDSPAKLAEPKSHGNPNGHVLYHVLWLDGQTDQSCPPCRQCYHKLAVLVKSYLATQDLDRTRLILYTDNVEGVSVNPQMRPLLPYLHLVRYSPKDIAKGTFMENNPLLEVADTKAYLTSDLFGWLVLYAYGGVYIDADTVLLNDFYPIYQKEFWARWACTDEIAVGVLRFRRRSPMVHAMLKELSRTAPRSDSYAWGSDLINQVLSKLEKANSPILRTVELLPACYFYPEWCMEGHHDYFSSRSGDKALYLGAFAYHWHGAGGRRYVLPTEHYSQFDRHEILIDRKLRLRFGQRAAHAIVSSETFDKYQAEPVCYRYQEQASVHRRRQSVALFVAMVVACVLAMARCLPPSHPLNTPWNRWIGPALIRGCSLAIQVMRPLGCVFGCFEYLAAKLRALWLRLSAAVHDNMLLRNLTQRLLSCLPMPMRPWASRACPVLLFFVLTSTSVNNPSPSLWIFLFLFFSLLSLSCFLSCSFFSYFRRVCS